MTQASDWNPAQYELFKDQRSRPFTDLVALIDKKPMATMIDLGCGTGDLTSQLHGQFSLKNSLGIDNSDAMLAKTAAINRFGLSFKKSSIVDFMPEKPVDLLFSNAALQWVRGHRSLFPRLGEMVSEKGQLAIQMAYNFLHPSHQVPISVAQQLFPHINAHASVHTSMLEMEDYAEMLYEAGFRRQVCRIQTYEMEFPNTDSIVEWTKGSLLTFYQAQMSAEDFSKFVDSYRDTLRLAMPKSPCFYAFKRLLLWGSKV